MRCGCWPSPQLPTLVALRIRYAYATHTLRIRYAYMRSVCAVGVGLLLSCRHLHDIGGQRLSARDPHNIADPQVPPEPRLELAMLAHDLSSAAFAAPAASKRESLYFCTSKASKVLAHDLSSAVFAAPAASKRECLYFCTSKASKESTCCSQPRHQGAA